MPASAISPNAARASAKQRVGVERVGEPYICSRQVQNEPVAGVRAPARRALERVRVRVGEARQREPAAARHPAAATPGAGARRDPIARDAR